jgi:transcriptional regulator with XRE-family HTH domain
MELLSDPGGLLRSARLRAGLSQRQLARRAETSQSLVSRVEQGLTSPTMATWIRLLNAAGFEPHVEIRPSVTRESHMLEDVARILSLTPEQRLLEVANLSRFVAGARHV